MPMPFEADDFILAYNLEFELAAWVWCHENLDWPELFPMDKYECLQARANYDGLPRRLAKVAKALGLGSLGKDDEGHRVMMRLTKPQCKGKQEYDGVLALHGEFDEDPDKHHRNEVYCLHDGRVERLVDQSTDRLPPKERELWPVHHAINTRGIPVDLDLCHNANRILELERNRLNDRLATLTCDRVETPDQLPALKEWMAEEMGLSKLPSLTKETIPGFIESEDTPEHVAEALSIRVEARDAAVSKYQAIINHAYNGRCRGQHRYYQAGTGRFQTTGVNFGNLRRLNDDLIDAQMAMCDTIASCKTDAEIYDVWQQMLQASRPGPSVIAQLAQPIRMAIKAPPGQKIAVCDLSAIEMRGLWWAAGDWARMKQLLLFDQGIGIEPYKMMAATCLGIPVEEVGKKERGIGKGIELGSGYVSGARSIQAFLKIYGCHVDLETAEKWKNIYRKEHPHVKRYWYRLYDACLDAVRSPGTEHVVGPITMYMARNRLNMRLPSGREIRYYDPVITDGMYGPEIECCNIGQKGGDKRWLTMPIAVENSVQGLCRDLLTEAMVRAHNEGLEIVLTVYDEIVIQCHEDDDQSPKLLQQIMEDAPDWAVKFPISTSLGESKRYTK
jgi:hypothetical protein